MELEGKHPLRIGLLAPNGRMGRALADEIAAAADLARDDNHADVLIDFSHPAALATHLDRALNAAVPILIGTTGLDDLAERRLDDAARTVPLLQAANTSLGVALLTHLVAQAAAKLGPDWDLSILEMHHRAKIDAPSGTALALGAAAPGRDPAYASLRGGTVAGDHDAIFAGPGERLILSHRAESRALFARGALHAARWLHGRPPGRYGMRDVLGLGDHTPTRSG